MLEEGALPQQVDKVLFDFGFPMGPFQMSDLAGNDVGWRIRQGKKEKEQRNVRYTGYVADAICELGRFGQKTGAGWYDYQAGKRDAIPSELVNKMIEDHRKELGITPRKISDEEIVQRLVYALVNEGAHILEDGIASKSGDIDMVYLTGYGFPIYRGGPMHYASQVGLYNVAESMKRFAKNPRDDAEFWQPAPLIQKLVADGKSFG
jgi:3-hydroxyacyl-CoA dehydrogenase